jgi:hypothetical protein
MPLMRPPAQRFAVNQTPTPQFHRVRDAAAILLRAAARDCAAVPRTDPLLRAHLALRTDIDRCCSALDLHYGRTYPWLHRVWSAC